MTDRPSHRTLLDRLELRGIRNAYPIVLANDGIDLRVAPGEIYIVVGENGAGKSTLMKIIYGIVQPDGGETLWNCREVTIASPADAQRLGIGLVFQHFALFDTFTVAENIALAMQNQPSIDELSRKIVALAARYGLPLDPGRHIYMMSVGERQRVEIIRALLRSLGLLILDEPTSVLTTQAVENLFVTLRQLAAEGCSILYISHKPDEIETLCDRATILRGGKVAGTCDPKHVGIAAMARMMIGGDLPVYRHRGQTVPGHVRLEVAGLSLPTRDPSGTALCDINVTVRGGEILGIAGVSGNSQQELLAVLSREQTLADKQVLRIDGVAAAHQGSASTPGAGLCCLPEDRLGSGSVPSLSLADNGLLTANRDSAVIGGIIRFDQITAFANDASPLSACDVPVPTPPAVSLSGGNLQKFIIGREILQNLGVLIMSQPT